MREEKNDPGEKQHFYKVEASTAELVELDTISLDDLGALAFMGCQVNSHTGFWITNHSIFARMANIRPDKARYIFEKLERAGLIRFLSCQRGRYSKGLLFVMGRSLANGRVVNDEFVARTAEKRGANSELESDFPNKKEEHLPKTATSEEIEKSRIDREGEETEIETEKEKDIYSHPLFKHISQENWALLTGRYERAWLETRLKSYSERLTKGPISFDRLTGMLTEDWQKNKPAKDFKSEQADDAEKRRKWEAEQKADEGKPPPKELEAWREKSKRLISETAAKVKA